MPFVLFTYFFTKLLSYKLAEFIYSMNLLTKSFEFTLMTSGFTESLTALYRIGHVSKLKDTKTVYQQ